MSKGARGIKLNNMYKTKNVLILAVGFMLVGLLAVFLTHDIKQEPVSFISQESYIDYIKPLVDNVSINPSLVSVRDVKENLLNFKGSDQSMGSAHIALFMAFNTWEKFLLTGDDSDRQQSMKHFSSAAIFLPELDSEIKILENILKQQNA